MPQGFNNASISRAGLRELRILDQAPRCVLQRPRAPEGGARLPRGGLPQSRVACAHRRRGGGSRPCPLSALAELWHCNRRQGIEARILEVAQGEGPGVLVV